MRRLFLASLLFSVPFVLPAHAEETAAPAPPAAAVPPSQFSAVQRTEIEAIIKDYLVKNPQVVVDALDAMQTEMNARQEAATIAAIKESHDELYATKLPYGGNPQGDVTIIEFFDYKCGYCRATQPILEQLLKDDPKVRILYKEFPILGQVSMQASRIALAANNQGKYLEMHNRLMSADTQVEADTLQQIAQDAGLNVEKVARDIASQDLLNDLRVNIELAQKLGVHGTPAFIIGDRLYPGSMDLNAFKTAVAQARQAAANPAPAAPAAPATP